jgi:hypothetical protein
MQEDLRLQRVMSAFDPKQTWDSQNCCCARSPLNPHSANRSFLFELRLT